MTKICFCNKTCTFSGTNIICDETHFYSIKYITSLGNHHKNCKSQEFSDRDIIKGGPKQARPTMFHRVRCQTSTHHVAIEGYIFINFYPRKRKLDKK